MSAPTYTYTATVPDASNPMNETQPLILANFQAINELVSINHVGFNTTNSGKHNLLSMQFQSEDPGTASTDLAMYTKATGSPNPSEIFYQYPNNGTVNQLTPATAAGGGGSVAATSGDGWCQFSSGIIMRWGIGTINGGGAVVFPTGEGIPVYQSFIGYVKVTLDASQSSNTNLSNVVPSNAYGLTEIFVYTYNASPFANTFYYLAIGL